MNTISSWEAQTKELINRVEQEITDAENLLVLLQAERQALAQALESYSKRLGYKTNSITQLINPNDMKNKSLHEILKLIALRNGGLLIARTAIRFMKEEKLFNNPLNADAAVYSVLIRSKDFVKVGKGVYKLNGHNGTTVKAIIGGKSELKKAIQELKEKNPQLTKVEVLNTLISKGFNFEGKTPKRAVHMAWVNMGYAKKGKEVQQPLLTDQQRLLRINPT